MFSAAEEQTVCSQTVAVLILKGPQGEHCVRSLVDGYDLLIGSDDSADLRVSGENVSSMHCMIRVRGRKLFARDCYSRTGTYVNGMRISEVQIDRNTIIDVGDFSISVTLNDTLNTPAENAETQISSGVTNETRLTESSRLCTEKTEPDEPQPSLRQLQLELELANAENEILRDQLAVAQSAAAASESDPCRDEMLELLRAEVVDLQSALASQHHTDSTTACCPEDSDSQSAETADFLSLAEAERLTERLESLLQELQERDEQMELLNNLLATAEFANRAEQEQRQQLDAWVGDIEQRMSLREEEWQAERGRLLDSLKQLKAERDRAESTVATSSTSSRLEALQKMISEMREEMDSLRAELSQSESECGRLRKEMHDTGKQNFSEEAIRISQERAEVARLRHELEELKPAAVNTTVASESSLRFQALREHLKEIHEQEKQHREETKLSSRIARLWQRLEGR